MVLAERPFTGLQVVRMLHNYTKWWYFTGDKRTTMMQDWANYLDSLQMGAQVIPFKTA